MVQPTNKRVLLESDKAAPNGVAALDPYGQVPDTQLPARLSDASLTAARATAIDQSRGFVSIKPTGVPATDRAAINNALATGADVEIASLTTVVMGIDATLLMHPTRRGQRLTTRNVRIAPNFIGDALQIRTQNQSVCAEFSGSLQPAGTTAYAEVCAIRIGSADAVYNAKNASVAGSSIIDQWKGSGIIWEQGAHVNFGHFTIDWSATYDGIRGTANCDDSNEGNFNGTRVSNCARYGYWFQNNATEPPKSSREHRFNDAKAFACGMNFNIETIRNTGSIYSENGVNPDTYATTSAANDIAYQSTQPDYGRVVDLGVGNCLSGMNAYGVWDSVTRRARSFIVNNLFAGRRRLTQTADNAFLDSIDGTSNFTTVTHNNAAGTNSRIDVFDQLGVSGVSGQTRLLKYQTGGVDRWQLGLTTDAEAGGNSGSNLGIFSRADDGSAITTVALFDRARGTTTLRRGFIQAVKTVNVTVAGAQTIDVSTGNKIEITLGANVTSTSFSNAALGQEIDVIWIQDVTGSRTYAWPSNTRFVGGAAPVATTTAGRRDIVKFYYGSDNLWHELSRSLNVA